MAMLPCVEDTGHWSDCQELTLTSPSVRHFLSRSDVPRATVILSFLLIQRALRHIICLVGL